MCICNIFVKCIICIDWCYNAIQIFIYAGGKKKPLKAPKKQSKEMDDVSSPVQVSVELSLHDKLLIVK